MSRKKYVTLCLRCAMEHVEALGIENYVQHLTEGRKQRRCDCCEQMWFIYSKVKAEAWNKLNAQDAPE